MYPYPINHFPVQPLRLPPPYYNTQRSAQYLASYTTPTTTRQLQNSQMATNAASNASTQLNLQMAANPISGVPTPTRQLNFPIATNTTSNSTITTQQNLQMAANNTTSSINPTSPPTHMQQQQNFSLADNIPSKSQPQENHQNATNALATASTSNTPTGTQNVPTPTPQRRHNQPLNRTALHLLNKWYDENIHDPYPKKAVQEYIALHGGITIQQVKAWFANKRNRSHNTRPQRQQRAVRYKLRWIRDQLLVNGRAPANFMQHFNAILASHE